MKKTILLLTCFALFFACNSDDDSGQIANEFDGSLESIEDFFNPELVQAMQDLGFIINTGANPPNLEGTFYADPLALEASTVPGDAVGQGFYPYTLTFTNQDFETLMVDFEGSQVSQNDVGYGSFVSGDGNAFSVYLKTTSTNNGHEVETALAISGVMTEDGIQDFQLAALMLDDNGDPNGNLIENNTGRLLYDSDLFSPRQ